MAQHYSQSPMHCDASPVDQTLELLCQDASPQPTVDDWSLQDDLACLKNLKADKHREEEAEHLFRTQLNHKERRQYMKNLAEQMLTEDLVALKDMGAGKNETRHAEHLFRTELGREERIKHMHHLEQQMMARDLELLQHLKLDEYQHQKAASMFERMNHMQRLAYMKETSAHKAAVSRKEAASHKDAVSNEETASSNPFCKTLSSERKGIAHSVVQRISSGSKVLPVGRVASSVVESTAVAPVDPSSAVAPVDPSSAPVDPSSAPVDPSSAVDRASDDPPLIDTIGAKVHKVPTVEGHGDGSANFEMVVGAIIDHRKHGLKSREWFILHKHGATLDDTISIASSIGPHCAALLGPNAVALVYKDRNARITVAEGWSTRSPTTGPKATQDAVLATLNTLFTRSCHYFSQMAIEAIPAPCSMYTYQQLKEHFQFATEAEWKDAVGEAQRAGSKFINYKEYPELAALHKGINTHHGLLSQDFADKSKVGRKMVYEVDSDETLKQCPFYWHDAKESCKKTVCWAFDIDTLKPFKFTLDEYMRSPLYKRHALWLHGAPNMCKSQVLHMMGKTFCIYFHKRWYIFGKHIDPCGMYTKSGKLATG